MKIEERYHDPILEIIKERGALGVNTIAAGIGMPVTSVQKYLIRQDYFKKTPDRKWDLPENVAEVLVQKQESNRLALLAQSLTTQGILTADALDMFSTNVMELVSQISKVAPLLESYIPPVAEKEKEVDPQLIKVMERVKETETVIKKHKENIPEEYVGILLNLDIVRLILTKGTDYLNGEFNTELASLLLGQTTNLSDEVLIVMKEHQK